MAEPRVLIVEDDIALAQMYRAALRDAGFEVDLAEDGLEALWHIDACRPGVIVLDLSLPRLRGEAVLTELASNPEMSGIPVVVVTGAVDDPATALPAAILHKPCDPDRLLEVIARVCTPGHGAPVV